MTNEHATHNPIMQVFFFFFLHHHLLTPQAFIDVRK